MNGTNFGTGGVWGFGNTGGGGGGSSTQGLLVVTGVCGQAGGPVAGQTTWTPPGSLLVGATMVAVAVVNNAPEMNVTSSPYNNFSFDDVGGTIDRAPNVWATGDTIILFYKPAPTP